MQVGSEATTWCSTLAQVCARLSADIIAVRRHLHANPELSLQEFATTAYLAERVEALGSMADVTQQRIGLTCDWQSRQTEASHRRIGLRGDIDALPIETTCTEQYASRSEGVMHACGHDAHASMVWGALAVLQELDRQDALPWPVAIRAIFNRPRRRARGAH